jgi:hypothetical protein
MDTFMNLVAIPAALLGIWWDTERLGHWAAEAADYSVGLGIASICIAGVIVCIWLSHPRD